MDRWPLLLALAVAACTGTTEEPTDTSTPTTTDKVTKTTPTAETATDTGTSTDDLYFLRASLNENHPTVIHVSWGQSFDGDMTVEYTFEKDEWLQAPTFAASKGQNEQALVGIPYGATVQWRVISDQASLDADEPVVLPDVPADMPVPTVVTATEAGWAAADRFVLTSISEDGRGWGSSGPYHAIIYDRQGRPVWSAKGAGGLRTLYAQVSVGRDNLLFDRFRGSSGSDQAIAVRTYLDEEIERIDIPGHHHAFIELPDGTLAWDSRAHGGGEALVEKAPGQVDETVVWTCRDDWVDDYCISNSLYYHAASDTYVYSFYTLETVVAIDRSKGTTLWWAGASVPNGYTFDPVDSQYWWQHGVFLTTEGNLMVSTWDRASFNASTNYGREYEIDHKNGVLRQVWSNDAGALASTNGDIRRLGNGNTLQALGSASEILEVDAKGTTVWHLDFNNGVSNRLVGRTELIDDIYGLLKPRDAGK